MKQSTGPRSQRPKTPSQQKPGQSRLSEGLARFHHRHCGRASARYFRGRLFDDPAAAVTDWCFSSGFQLASVRRTGGMGVVLSAGRTRPTRYGRGSGISLGGSHGGGAGCDSRGPCRGCLRWRLHVPASPRGWGAPLTRALLPHLWGDITVDSCTYRSSYRRPDLRPPGKTSEAAIESTLLWLRSSPVSP
jgi:hypothetical protein